MRILEESEEVVSKEIYSDDVITGTQYLKKVLQGGLNPVWMKLYKSSLVKTKTEYINLKAGEDLLLTIQWALRANVVAFCPNIIYNYIVCRPRSTMSSDPRVYIKSTFEASYLVFCILNVKPFNKLFERELTNFVCINCYVYLSNLKNEFFNNKTKLKVMSSFISERRYFLSSRQLRVFSYIFLYNLSLAHWFVKFIQKVKPSINPHFR